MAVNLDKQLFDVENAALQSARANCDSHVFAENELLSHYEQLTDAYEKLLRVAKKVFRISDSQGRILHRHQSEIKNLLDNVNQGFLTFGSDFAVDRQYSAECVQIFGKKISGICILDLLAENQQTIADLFRDVFSKAFATPDPDEQIQLLRGLPTLLTICHKDVHMECKLISQWDEDSERKIIMLVLTDVTEKRKAEEQIHYLSYHDKLTALYNRTYVDSALPELDAPANWPLGVIVIDMNGLKLTNDVYGHEQGDRLIVRLAQVLQQTCRKKDIISRWGGDEFLILLPTSGVAVCEHVCTRIREALQAEPSDPIPLSAAMGAAIKENDATGIGEVFSAAESMMYSDKLLSAKQVRQTLLSSVGQTLTRRCHESDSHTERVQTLARGFATYLGLQPEATEYKVIDLLAPLHDVGKVAIPQSILGKPGPLTSEEWEIIKSHSEIGCRMAQSIGETTLADCIIALHERWDGKGYPYGLDGQSIPYVARLFSLIDVFDVLTHNRPYRLGVSSKEALAIIEAEAGHQFDPKLAVEFVGYINKLDF